ncbi:hypothetical protein CsSME_00008092 [Camellia sinensis var. sinensis]
MACAPYVRQLQPRYCLQSRLASADHAAHSTRRRSAQLLSFPTKMANQQQLTTRPRILEAASLTVVILMAAHVLALVYWIYSLATEKQPQRRKEH